ncbi:MAG: histone deacetylase family protein [Pseudomonadota bacterium]
MNTRVYTHVDCDGHRPGAHHPESPQRLVAVLEALRAPQFSSLEWCEAPLGTRRQVELVHDADYIDAIAEARPEHGLVSLDGGDTVMSPGSWQAVMRCVGAACAGVDDVMLGRADNVFCATRPCGHHAEPDQAMGFCIFNQAAIAAVHASRAYHLERVLVVDFDVHHGNGTQAAFTPLKGMYYASSHQSPLYPGTGAKSEKGHHGNILNLPLPPGCDSATFRQRIAADMLPALRAWAPQLVIISAGFDAHRDDPLAGLNLVDDDFYWITRELVQLAADSAEGRIVSILEGGYSAQGLAGGVTAHLRALME